MKKLFNTPEGLFTLLSGISVAAMGLGVYLAVALGLTALSALGLLLWLTAWGAFLRLTLLLRTGASAFCQTSVAVLRIIGVCMAALGILTLIQGVTVSRGSAFVLVECVALPGLFGAVAAVACALLARLDKAMKLEEEQEGVV